MNAIELLLGKTIEDFPIRDVKNYCVCLKSPIVFVWSSSNPADYLEFSDYPDLLLVHTSMRTKGKYASFWRIPPKNVHMYNLVLSKHAKFPQIQFDMVSDEWYWDCIIDLSRKNACHCTRYFTEILYAKGFTTYDQFYGKHYFKIVNLFDSTPAADDSDSGLVKTVLGYFGFN